MCSQCSVQSVLGTQVAGHDRYILLADSFESLSVNGLKCQPGNSWRGRGLAQDRAQEKLNGHQASGTRLYSQHMLGALPHNHAECWSPVCSVILTTVRSLSLGGQICIRWCHYKDEGRKGREIYRNISERNENERIRQYFKVEIESSETVKQIKEENCKWEEEIRKFHQGRYISILGGFLKVSEHPYDF